MIQTERLNLMMKLSICNCSHNQILLYFSVVRFETIWWKETVSTKEEENKQMIS